MEKRILTLLIAAICGSQLAQGLECYKCMYEVVDGVEQGDLECKDGNSLPAGLLKSCNPMTEIAVPGRVDDIPTLGGLSSAFGQSPNERSYACVTVVAKGEVNTTGTPVAATRTMRTCASMNAEPEAVCKKERKSDWTGDNDEFSQFVAWVAHDFTGDSEEEGCLCKEEKCNGKGEEGDGDGKGNASFISTSMSLMFISVIVVLLQNYV